MNIVALTGRLGADPVINNYKNEKNEDGEIVYFDLAVNSYGGGEEHTELVHCKAWNKTAKNFFDVAKRGDLIEIEGAIRNDRYTKDDVQIEKTFVIVKRFWVYKKNTDNPGMNKTEVAKEQDEEEF